MSKKIFLIGLVIITAFTLLYYVNIKLIRSENSKIQQDLQSKINNLQQELQSKTNNADANKTVNNNGTNTPQVQSNLVLTDVKIQTNEAYNEGLSKGAIYGSFDVKARVKNIGSVDIYNVKVASLFVKSNSRYAKDIGADAKSQGIDKLSPGQEQEVTFTGYHVVHPETFQELNVSILHPSITVNNEGSTVKRLRITAAFPPGSND